MTLRIMLVGLVASLGFELPSGSDVSCWAKAGQTWIQSKMIDPSGPETVEPKLDVVVPTDCRQVVEKSEVPSIVSEKETCAADAAFQVVTESIAVDLSADLLANHREEAPAEPVVARVELEAPAPVVLPEAEEAGCLIVNADEAKTAESAWTLDEAKSTEPVETIVEDAPKPDRVSAAVRLTREAVQAWADLMQEAVGQ